MSTAAFISTATRTALISSLDQKLMLEFCFEPGWPVKTFEMDSFPVSSLLGAGE